MKILKKILLLAIVLVASALAILIITGHGYILTGITRTYLRGETTANINDYQYFNTREVKANEAQPWKESPDFIKGNLDTDFANSLKEQDGVAFLVAHKGKLIAEQYFKAYDDRSKTNSFSMAKTVVTMLTQIAVQEDYITSFDDKITTLLPEFSSDEFGKNATLRSLSTMSSGYDWDEHYYSPFSPTVELLYGPNVEKFVLDRSFSKEADTYFYYSSASTQLLTIALSRALKAKDADLSVSQYLSEKLWQPLGMNDVAVWHLDNNGMELGYCCINTNARNFAKLGQLLLQNGNWAGKQLIDSSFVQKMSTSIFVNDYGYSTWINNAYKTPYFMFVGHLGQYIIVVPSHDLVIVRLGESRGGIEDFVPVLNTYVDEALTMIE